MSIPRMVKGIFPALWFVVFIFAWTPVPKVQKDGYIPFFVTEKNRSEQALIPLLTWVFKLEGQKKNLTRFTSSD